MKMAALVPMVIVAVALSGCPTVPPANDGGTGPTTTTTPTPATSSGELSDDTVDRVKDAVVLVELTLDLAGGQRWDGTGSGFFISDDGYAVTNAHVISMTQHDEDGTPLTGTNRVVRLVLHAGTSQEESVDAEVVRENQELDLALLRVSRTPDAHLQLNDSDAAKETSRVYACGHPLGMPELSIRSGTVSAHRIWDNRKMIEHDADIENGNSGGPIVDADGKVIAVTVLRLRVSYGDTKLAIPSNVLRDWLKSDPSDDPKPLVVDTSTSPVARLLDDAGLKYEEMVPGLYSMDFDNGTTVAAQELQEFLRIFTSLGPLPGNTVEEQDGYAFDALRLTYDAPVGKYTVNETDGGKMMYWEELVPIFAVTPGHVASLAMAGANEAARWQQLLDGQELSSVEHLFPEGDETTQLAQLKGLLDQSGLKYTEGENLFEVPYDNDVVIRTKIYKGMVYTYCQIGGMPPGPNAPPSEYAGVAASLLQRNYGDSFGRLALDDDEDVVWESQIPIDFLTPDYLSLVAGAGAGNVASYLEAFGDIPFAGA